MPRPRITGILDDEWPAVLLHAPSGYGKTSALVEWARTRTSPGVVWVTLDERMGRPEFWCRVRDVLLRDGLVDSRPLSAQDFAGSAESARPAILDLIEASLVPVDLVVDAAQASLPHQLDDDLVFLLRHSDRIRLRLASRSSSALTDVSTAISLDRRVVDLRELRFSLGEVHQLAASAAVHASNEHVAQLHRSTDGWPFAIRTALQLRPRSVTNAHEPWFHDAPFDEGMAYVRRVLLDEFTGFPGFRGLVPTAVLEVFTTEQAVALGVESIDAKALNELEARGLGAWEVDAPEPRFRLQPLLREALLEGIPRTELLELHSRMAAWWMGRDLALAFQAAISAEDWSLAARLARRDFVAVAASISRDQQAFARVPRSALRSEPMLSILSGLGHYIAGDIPRAMRTFALVVASGEQLRALRADPTTVEQVWIQGLVAIALRLMGRWEVVPTAVKSFERMLSRVDDPADDLATALPLMLTQLANTHILLDRLDDARAALAHRRNTRVAPAHPRRSVHIDSLDALIDGLDGDILGAQNKVDALRTTELPQTVERGFLALPLSLAQAIICLEQLDGQGAAAHLQETSSHWESIEIWPLIAHARAHTEWMLVGPESALSLLAEIRAEKRARPAISTAMTAMLDAITAEMLLALGRGAEARALTSSRRRRAHPRLAIPAARDLLIAGEHEQALGLADAVVRQARIPRVQLDALTIAAAAANQGKEVDTANDRFRAAADLANRTGLKLAFFAMPREDFAALSHDSRLSAELRDAVSTARPAFPTPGHAVRLTPREQVVIEELATGAPISEVARRLNVSVNTVKAQTRSISRKLDASGRAEIVAAARRRKVL